MKDKGMIAGEELIRVTLNKNWLNKKDKLDDRGIANQVVSE